ncbi:hypothetical protein ACFUC1_04070 [Pedococcus sp. NPDC057267]|uniref:hypothetical protein n=1 Tax=Pedococcus sp. NPDC057267 TaxID=3346077 RepID=UPI00363E2F84
MPAAFVLQWLLEVAAVPAAYAAVHTAHLVDPLGAGLSFALEPRQLYPVVVQLREAQVTPVLLEERLGAAHAAYLSAATELALTYRPGVHLGTHQRLEMVRDVWAMALARACGQPPPQRGSCCYLYVLPGTHECTGCPRLRRRPPAVDRHADR